MPLLMRLTVMVTFAMSVCGIDVWDYAETYTLQG